MRPRHAEAQPDNVPMLSLEQQATKNIKRPKLPAANKGNMAAF